MSIKFGCYLKIIFKIHLPNESKVCRLSKPQFVVSTFIKGASTTPKLISVNFLAFNFSGLILKNSAVLEISSRLLFILKPFMIYSSVCCSSLLDLQRKQGKVVFPSPHALSLKKYNCFVWKSKRIKVTDIFCQLCLFGWQKLFSILFLHQYLITWCYLLSELTAEFLIYG